MKWLVLFPEGASTSSGERLDTPRSVDYTVVHFEESKQLYRSTFGWFTAQVVQRCTQPIERPVSTRFLVHKVDLSGPCIL